MQAQLNNLLGLHRTKSRVSIDSISTLAGSINTKKAFKKFCQNLYQIGVRADLIKEKEREILDIFKAQNTDTNNLDVDVGNTADQNKPQNTAISSKIDASHVAGQSKPQNKITGGRIDDRNIVNLPVSVL